MKIGLINRPTRALLAAGLLAGASAVQAAGGITVLHSFNYDDGQYPEGRLVQGNDGAFYGTTYAGGANHLGEIYKVSADGTFTILHSFTGNDGNSLNSGMVLASDGNFYGTTPQTAFCVGSICSNYGGTVFRMTPDGTLTTLYTFKNSANGWEAGPLSDGGNGLFYGTTYSGGSFDGGTAFSVAPDGSFAQLNSFGAVGQGDLPRGALTKGSDGNFYGTTSVGGSSNKGTAYRMTPAGAVTTLHNFTGGTDGSSPTGALLQGSDGNFYGSAGGGANGGGVVFRMTPAGAITPLHAFNGADGSGAVGSLVAGSDGYLYGASGGGYLGYGTLFRIKPDGTGFLTLHLFSPAEGTGPASAPIFGSDGRLYGTTIQYGGSPGASGSTYAFDLSAPQTPVLHLTKTCINEFDICFTPINTVIGQSVRLDWSSSDVTSCKASGAWLGNKPTGGSYTFVALKAGIFTYRLTCNGPNGKITAKTTLTVGL